MQTPDQARERAADIVARAVRAGADAADAVFAADASLDISVRLGALEDVGRSESEELGLRVFVGQRSASVSTSDLSDDAVAALVERAVAMAREAPEDRWAGLAPQERLLHGAPPLLDLDDGGALSPAELRELALAAEDAARAVPGVTNSEGGGASASRGPRAVAPGAVVDVRTWPGTRRRGGVGTATAGGGRRIRCRVGHRPSCCRVRGRRG